MIKQLFSIKVGKGKYMYIAADDFMSALAIYKMLGNTFSIVQSIRTVKRPRWKSARIYGLEDFISRIYKVEDII